MSTRRPRLTADETETSTALIELDYIFGGALLITLDDGGWHAAPTAPGWPELRRASPAGLALALHAARPR